MKILWASLRAYPAYGGAEKLFYEFTKRLINDGHSVIVATTDILSTKMIITNKWKRPKNLPKIKDGIIFRRYKRILFPYDRRIAYYLSKFRFRDNHFLQGVFGRPYIWIPGYTAFCYLSKENFDIVIAGPHPYYPIIHPALSIAKRKGIPFIDYALLHTGIPHSDIESNEYVSPIGRFIMEHSDAVIGTTEGERKLIEKVGIDAKKFYSIGAGINIDEIKGGNGKRFRGKYNIKGNIILQVSVQTGIKGTITLIKAGELLIKRGIPINIVLIGEVLPDVRKYLMSIPYGMKRYIKVLGNVPENDKKDALAASDVFVMISKTDSFGISYLEAWMYKKPVIGAYAGGIPYVIDNGINGYLIPYGDYHILSEYIEILLKNKAIAKRFGENGYRKTIKNYLWDIQYQKFRKILDKIKNP